jgi:hypothetical protein
MDLRISNPLAQFSERQLKANPVSDQSTAFHRMEGVLMIPEGVRTLQLIVHEPNRGLPLGNISEPSQGQSMKSKAVANAGPLTDLLRSDLFDLEVKPFRSDGLEITGIGKKRKNLFKGFWNELLYILNENGFLGSKGMKSPLGDLREHRIEIGIF